VTGTAGGTSASRYGAPGRAALNSKRLAEPTAWRLAALKLARPRD
jgi:hypothetical protein